MTDTTDNIVLSATIDNPLFQERCRLRFINAAIAVGSEVISTTATAQSSAGTKTLTVASTVGILQSMTVSDVFAGVIPVGTLVESASGGSVGGTVTLNNALTGTVSVGDVVAFAPVSHTQRLAFAGALYAGTVDPKMLAMVVLANATNRTNCLADPTHAGGTILDSDIDFQVNSVFTGVAISRSW